MATNNHMNKYSDSYTANNLASFSNAATHVLRGTIVKKPRIFEYRDYSTKDRHLNWWEITQDRVSRNIASEKDNVDLENFDEYTFTTTDEKLHFMAGHVLGKFDGTTKLPYFPYDENHVLSDILGASMINALRGNFELAYAYLRTVQLFISLANDEGREYTESKPYKSTAKPYQL